MGKQRLKQVPYLTSPLLHEISAEQNTPFWHAAPSKLDHIQMRPQAKTILDLSIKKNRTKTKFMLCQVISGFTVLRCMVSFHQVSAKCIMFYHFKQHSGICQHYSIERLHYPPIDTPAAMSGAASLLLWMCSITVSRSSVLAAQQVLGVFVRQKDNAVTHLQLFMSIRIIDVKILNKNAKSKISNHLISVQTTL